MHASRKPRTSAKVFAALTYLVAAAYAYMCIAGQAI